MTTEQAILEATRELLAEGGVPKLTVEGVAARAGVAKTTIYRRYRSRDELALAVLIDMVEQVVSVPELGDTRAELVAFVDGAVKILGSTLMGRVMQGSSPSWLRTRSWRRHSASASSPCASPECGDSSSAGSSAATSARTPTTSSRTSCSSARSTTACS